MTATDQEMERLRQVIGKIAEPIVEEAGLLVYDLTCWRRKRNIIVRLTLDKLEGELGVEDCERVSKKLGTALDIEDLILGKYFLEVSTPGVERPLRSLEECRRFIDRLAMFTFEDGSSIVGKITVVEGEKIIVTPQGEEPVQFTFGSWQRANLKLDLKELFKKKKRK